MNKLMVLFSTLVLASLACMEQTQTYVAPFPTTQPTATEIESGEVFEVSAWTPAPTQPAKTCAIVTAVQSLHLRQNPNDRAPIVDYLTAGERVTLDENDGDWWKITTSAGLHGYSHMHYLEVVPCQ